MSYAQAMRWHKKHPKGIRNLYLGFDCSSSPQPPHTVYMKLKNGETVWEYIGEMTVSEACANHPDAKRFANMSTGFRCNGPAHIAKTTREKP